MKTSPATTKNRSTEISTKEDAIQTSNKLTSEERIKEKFSYRHRCYGWTTLLIFILFGTLLESLLGFKSIGLLFDPLRRELWSLAHFHGAVLALVNLVYAQWADNANLQIYQKNSASWALIIGSICMPIGFFGGGVAHPEGDPSIAIFLVPFGALLICYSIGLQVFAIWKKQ